jgi:hypothetical protein
MGYLALRRIGELFHVQYKHKPSFPEDPISITRPEFDAALDKLAAAGVPLKADRDAAWQDFGGWRVNYDSTLHSLADLVMAPEAPWSSDRAPVFGGLPDHFKPLKNHAKKN